MVRLCCLLLPLFTSNVCALPADTEIKAKRDALSGQQQTGELQRLADIYSSILEYSELSKQFTERREAIEKSIEEAPALLDRLKLQTKQLERSPPTLNVQRYSQTESEDTQESVALINIIEERLAQENSSYVRLESGLKLLKEQLEDARTRRSGLQAESKKVTQRLADIEKNLANYVEDSNATALEQARHWLLEAELESLRNQSALLQQEWIYSQPEINITQAKIRNTQLQVKYASEQVTTLKDLLSSARIKMANQTALETQQELVESQDKHPLVIELATSNADLSQQVGKLSLQLREAQQRSTELSQQIAQLKERYLASRQKIEIAGLSQAIGQLLLKEMQSIPLSAPTKRDARALQEQLANVGLSQLEHQRERRELSDIPGYISDLSAMTTEDARATIEPLLKELAESRRDLLDKAIETEQALLQSLTEVEWSAIELENTITEFSAFLTERLLWVRSAPSVSWDLLVRSYRSLTDKQLIRKSGLDDFSIDKLHFSFWNGLGLLVAGIIVVKGRQLRTLLVEQLLPLQRLATDSIRYTVQAALLTALLAAPLPLVILVAGDCLQLSAEKNSLIAVLGSVLITIAGYAFVLQTIRKMCLADGVIIGHLKWPANIATEIRKDLSHLVYLFLPAALVTGVVIRAETDADLGALPHICLLLALLILTYCFYRFFSNSKGLLAVYRRSVNQHPPLFIQKGLRLIMISAPMVFAVLGLMGYIISAGTLAERLLDSCIFLIIAYFLQQFILRWLTLNQRQLAYKAALEKRAAKQKKAAAQEDVSTPEKPEVEEYTIDLDQLSKGAQQLFSTLLSVFTVAGVWLIWSDVFPAFTLLQDVSVWTYSEMSNNQEQIVPVTLFDLGLALLALAVTFLAAKRVPALLEFVLLQRIKMSAGGHYTVRTLTGYVIIAIGFFSILSTLGASWSQLQWLAAALSVGIGFGLQEIVANFISGLIILFERPIRVGDVVTVGDTDGTVTRIQIRATTIRNWDQKELLVPNKEFITSRLLNWTLSDQTVRLLIPVGIAYGSDVAEAMKLMSDILIKHPKILQDPSPLVTFESFGDNALVLYLRAYVGRIEHRLIVVTDLHVEIYQALNDAGIGIAFPQRDIHLDTNKPLELHITKLNSQQQTDD